MEIMARSEFMSIVIVAIVLAVSFNYGMCDQKRSIRQKKITNRLKSKILCDDKNGNSLFKKEKTSEINLTIIR